MKLALALDIIAPMLVWWVVWIPVVAANEEEKVVPSMFGSHHHNGTTTAAATALGKNTTQSVERKAAALRGRRHDWHHSLIDPEAMNEPQKQAHHHHHRELANGCDTNGCKDLPDYGGKEAYLDRLVDFYAQGLVLSITEFVPYGGFVVDAFNLTNDFFSEPATDPFAAILEEISAIVDYKLDALKLETDLSDFKGWISNIHYNLDQYEKYADVRDLNQAEDDCGLFHLMLHEDGVGERALRARLAFVNEYCLLCSTVHAACRNEAETDLERVGAENAQADTIHDCTIKAPALVTGAIQERLEHVPVEATVTTNSAGDCSQLSFTGKWNYYAKDGDTAVIVDWKEKGECTFWSRDKECKGLRDEANQCVTDYRANLKANLNRFYYENIIQPAAAIQGALGQPYQYCLKSSQPWFNTVLSRLVTSWSWTVPVVPEHCREYCLGGGFKFYGTTFTVGATLQLQCYCGDQVEDGFPKSDGCILGCPGDPSQKCGALWETMVGSTGWSRPILPPSSSRAIPNRNYYTARLANGGDEVEAIEEISINGADPEECPSECTERWWCKSAITSQSTCKLFANNRRMFFRDLDQSNSIEHPETYLQKLYPGPIRTVDYSAYFNPSGAPPYVRGNGTLDVNIGTQDGSWYDYLVNCGAWGPKTLLIKAAAWEVVSLHATPNGGGHDHLFDVNGTGWNDPKILKGEITCGGPTTIRFKTNNGGTNFHWFHIAENPYFFRIRAVDWSSHGPDQEDPFIRGSGTPDVNVGTKHEQWYEYSIDCGLPGTKSILINAAREGSGDIKVSLLGGETLPSTRISTGGWNNFETRLAGSIVCGGQSRIKLEHIGGVNIKWIELWNNPLRVSAVEYSNHISNPYIRHSGTAEVNIGAKHAEQFEYRVNCGAPGNKLITINVARPCCADINLRLDGDGGVSAHTFSGINSGSWNSFASYTSPPMSCSGETTVRFTHDGGVNFKWFEVWGPVRVRAIDYSASKRNEDSIYFRGKGTADVNIGVKVGDWYDYRINCGPPGQKMLAVHYASPGGSDIDVYIDNVLQEGVVVDIVDTGGFGTFSTISSSASFSCGGEHTLRLHFGDGVNFQWLDIGLP